MAEPEKVKKIFSKQNILEKQNAAREEYDKKVQEIRQALELVAATPSGEKVLEYLFLLCGGDQALVRREKEGRISINDTLVVLGAKSVWEILRFNLASETIKKIERRNWEK